MIRLLLLLCMLLSSAIALAQTFPAIVQDATGFHYYDLLPDNAVGRNLALPGGAKTNRAYSDLVPPGETRDILIHRVSLNIQGPIQQNQYTASLVVESYLRWKILTMVHDGPEPYKAESFSVPVRLSQHEYLCVQEMWNSGAYQSPVPSWRFPAGGTRKIVGVYVHYSIAQ